MKALAVIVLLGVGVMLLTGWIGGGGGHPRVFADVAFNDAMGKLSGTGDVLLVKVTATWCGPCKMMDRDTFSDSRVEKWFADRGAHALAIAVDTDASPAVAQGLGVRSIPTTILIVGGEERGRLTGYRDPDELLTWLEQSSR